MPQHRRSHYCGLIALSITFVAVALASTTSARAQDADAQTVPPPRPTARIDVSVYDQRHSISPYIYGAGFPESQAAVSSERISVSRWGGNATSNYNWTNGATNAGSDWYFENRASGSLGDWMRMVEAGGSAPIVAVPMLDWVAKDETSYSYSVAKYGPQQKTDPYKPDAGNGKTADSRPIVVSDQRDAYVPLLDSPKPSDPPGAVYRDAWIRQLAREFADHPHFYECDNEPEIWSSTHQDCHPLPATYQELGDRFVRTARLIKDNDPQALVGGPVASGWWFYWNSAEGAPDKAANGGIDYLPWWIASVAAADRADNRKSLDMLDVHAYLDYDTTGLSNEAADAMRLRCTRQYWDPTYRDEGWIGRNSDVTKSQPLPRNLALIPRLTAVLGALYPTVDKLVFSEWSLDGNDNSIVTALADADAYGIFGREGLFGAMRSTAPKTDSKCASALAMYRSFGTVSIDAHSSLDPNVFSAYAAMTDDGSTLTVMAINKDPFDPVTADIRFSGFKPTTFTSYTLTADLPGTISNPDQAALMPYTFAPYSETLLCFSGKCDPRTLDWFCGPADLMLVSGRRGKLNPALETGHNGVLRLVSVTTDPGVAMTITSPIVRTGHPGEVSVQAGRKPGFYRYTITAKTQGGLLERQSGWIVIGSRLSLTP
jgi:hypothetical protein